MMQHDRAGGPGRDVLLREEAAQRSRRVRDVTYQLAFDLSAGRDTYGGRSRIEFELLGTSDASLFLDFSGKVLALWVNERELTPDHRDHRLWLPADAMASRKNANLCSAGVDQYITSRCKPVGRFHDIVATRGGQIGKPRPS